MTENKYVLRLLTVEESKQLFFNEQSSIIINYLLKKVLFSQPEIPLGDKPKNIQITKKYTNNQGVFRNLDCSSL